MMHIYGTTKTRLIITMPDVLRKAVCKAAKSRQCSKAEVVRVAMYEHLKSFIEKAER